MREHRWESENPVDFQELLEVCSRLRGTGFKIHEEELDRACYFDEFMVKGLDEIGRLAPWVIDELTLVEVTKGWKGDFFLLAGRHHNLFREHERMEAYLSICHPWQIPHHLETQYHDPESIFWIGFRDTHAFVRVRLVPKEIITPGERGSEDQCQAWLTERTNIYSQIIAELNLPIEVKREDKSVTLFSTDSSALLSVTWPDAFGPCQFEFVVSDRYSLLVPASRFVSKFGIQGSNLRVFLSGFPLEQLKRIHQLQSAAALSYRGFLQAPMTDLPDIVAAVAPVGKGLINLCDFQTDHFVSSAISAEGVIGVIGDPRGYKIEVRLNRTPLSKLETGTWLERVIGAPMVYSPLPLF
jgi:hypothetical protein